MYSCKEVWSKRMFLRPQHFQQQERYLEFFTHLRAMSAEPYFWGFCELVLDLEALALGKIALVKAVGVFPDGTPFSFPGQDSMVDPLEVDKACKDERIYLALPMRRVLATELSFEDDDVLARYTSEDTELTDSNSQSGEPALAQVAHMRARLIPASKITDEWLRCTLREIFRACGWSSGPSNLDKTLTATWSQNHSAMCIA